MMRDQARDELKSRLTDYVNNVTTPSKGTNMYVCPLCHSGEGKHKTGAFSIYNNGEKWKCHACGLGGDIFELIGKVEGITDFKEQLDKAAEIFHITFENNNEHKKGYMTMTKTEIKKTENAATSEETAEDCTKIFKQAQDLLFNGEDKRGLEYLHKRGISDETAKKFGLGYDPAWRHPKAPKVVPTSPRIIIPTSKSTYFARDIRSNLSENDDKYKKQNVGGVNMLNTEALYNSSTPVFIVEGQIDMLSIIEVGGNAVSLGTTGKVNDFLSLIGKKPPTQPLLICLDNDRVNGGNAGEKAAEKLMNGLVKLGIPYMQYNVSGKYKDPNDALAANREEFTAAVMRGNDIESLRNETEIAEKEEYIQISAKSRLQGFINGISESVNTPCISTGFPKLDEVLDGGLYEGLYFLGGGTSSGKTTFSMQLIDNVAASGYDVLTFALEMSANDLMAKSVSRISYDTAIQNGLNPGWAKTARGITDGKRYASYCKQEIDLINNSIQEYEKYSEHIYIIEGIGNIDIDYIVEAVKKHIKCTGKIPVVCVDYLQILAPCKGYERSTDKQIIDKTVLELKRLSREYKTPVLAISSFARAGYDKEAKLQSFKESGSIEYGCDVCLGLQMDGAGEDGFCETDNDSDTRNIIIKVLKNRFGKRGTKLKYNYYPAFNLIREM